MANINFGQYVPLKSTLHALDPRTKLLLIVAFMVAALALSGIASCLIILAAVIMMMLLARIPLRTYFRSVKPFLVIVAITGGFQLFLVPGTAVFRWGVMKVTDQGLIMAALMAYRLLVIYLLAQLLTVTTSPMQLTAGLERAFQPLERIGVPVHELAMIMTIALRFIPVLFEESEKIIKAQMSRGADLQSGWLRGITNLVAIVVPLLTRAFQRANDLALAMEVRCYAGGAGRTRLHELKMGINDSLALASAAVMIVMASLFRG